MNAKSILFLSLILITTGIQAQRIKGSDTVLPVAQQTAERFMNRNADSRVTVTGGGTGVGISALMDNTTDIAMASRPIKFSEKMKARAAQKNIEEVIVAYDALAVVVHPTNPVKQLTRQQLEDIFRGKITNWKQVGGEDRKIVVYSRETSSGTYEFFKESVLKNKNYMSSSLSMPATGAIIQSVSQTKGAIGLYDTVEARFYKNAGSGAFAAGAEVSRPEVDPYEWTEDYYPTAEQMAQYIANVEALRGVIAVLPSTPDKPDSMELLDHVKANNIEKILVDIDKLLQNMPSAWFYSGEVNCGEV